jgi:hypothetical protein
MKEPETSDPQFAVDPRECQHCHHSRKLHDGWICKKHLMAVTPDMHVTYDVAKGTCWEDAS